MLPLKDIKDLYYSAYLVCEVESCKDEAARVYASPESRIIDLCDNHYDHIMNERFVN